MNYTNSQIREVIAEYIHNERDRKILERRLIDGITFERLAAVEPLHLHRGGEPGGELFRPQTLRGNLGLVSDAE